MRRPGEEGLKQSQTLRVACCLDGIHPGGVVRPPPSFASRHLASFCSGGGSVGSVEGGCGFPGGLLRTPQPKDEKRSGLGRAASSTLNLACCCLNRARARATLPRASQTSAKSSSSRRARSSSETPKRRDGVDCGGWVVGGPLGGASRGALTTGGAGVNFGVLWVRGRAPFVFICRRLGAS